MQFANSKIAYVENTRVDQQIVDKFVFVWAQQINYLNGDILGMEL